MRRLAIYGVSRALAHSIFSVTSGAPASSTSSLLRTHAALASTIHRVTHVAPHSYLFGRESQTHLSLISAV